MDLPLAAAEPERNGIVLEDVDELLIVVEGDCALCAVVVLHENSTLRADDVAARVRHLAFVRSGPLGHDLSIRLHIAVVPVEREGGKHDAGAHLGLAGLVGKTHPGL